MFERAMSPVVRLANLVSPCGASAGLLALACGLPPGPEAIRLLAQVRPELLDDVQRTELLVGWERCGRWLEAQRVGAVVGAAGPALADRDDFAREHVRVALLGCGGSARAMWIWLGPCAGRWPRFGRRWSAASCPTATPGRWIMRPLPWSRR